MFMSINSNVNVNVNVNVNINTNTNANATQKKKSIRFTWSKKIDMIHHPCRVEGLDWLGTLDDWLKGCGGVRRGK